MSLLERLRQDQLTARKNRDEVATGLLTALVGEAAMVGKNNGNRDSTDEEVQATVTKFLKNAKESRNAVATRGGEALAKLDAEITILEGYLPRQMSADEIREVVTKFKEANATANMGMVMAHLKTNYGGTYDGKLASTVAKEVL